MINCAAQGTIDERALNKPKKSKRLNVYQMKENQQLVIQSAKAIGCIVVNVHPQSLVEGAPKQTLVRCVHANKPSTMAFAHVHSHFGPMFLATGPGLADHSNAAHVFNQFEEPP